MSGIGGRPVRIGPRWVNVGFGVALLAVADLAWGTAVTTSGPWFSPAVSIQVYSLSIVLAFAVAIVVTIVAVGRLARIEEAARELAVPQGRDPEATQPEDAPQNEVMSVEVREDAEVEELLDEIAASVSEGLVQVELPAREAARNPAREAGFEVEERQTHDSLRRQRRPLREARAQIRTAAAGPVVASLAFLFAAGAMLPGSEGFAVRNFVLNTALVLFLSYGWVFLVAWGLAALATMPRIRFPTLRGT